MCLYCAHVLTWLDAYSVFLPSLPDLEEGTCYNNISSNYLGISAICSGYPSVGYKVEDSLNLALVVGINCQ